MTEKQRKLLEHRNEADYTGPLGPLGAFVWRPAQSTRREDVASENPVSWNSSPQKRYFSLYLFIN